jgi:hypothetical protein
VGKKRQKKQETLRAQEEAVIAKYRRTMERDQDEDFLALLDKILALRNDGMKANQIATYLRIGREIIYNYTAYVPAFMLANEIGEMIFGARALRMNLAEYLLFLHSQYGVEYVRKNGDPKLKQRMFNIAAGEAP